MIASARELTGPSTLATIPVVMTEEELSLGKYIRSLRMAKEMSLLDLSNRTKVAYSHLSRIENESTIPNPETIVKIADELSGDLTVMLQKANNLPRVILDRLLERDKAVRIQTLRRSFPDSPGDDQGSDSDALRALVNGNLSQDDVLQLKAAIDGLLTLRPHARQAIIQLISVLHDDEADGDSG
jgi:transcriptional regulator with XRE-family HTH domain